MLSQQLADRISQDAAAAATERSEASTGRHAADRDEHATEGGCLSNTHPQPSQSACASMPAGWHVSGGFDWLSWSASIKWNPLSFSTTMEELDDAKAECQERQEKSQWLDLESIGPIRVFRQGFNRGGDAGQHFEYRISYRDVAIGLARMPCGTKWRPNLFVCMKGRDCLLLGAREGYEIVHQFIRRHGCEIEWEHVGRADLCLDVVGLDVRLLQEAAEQDQFITSARHVQPWVNLVGHIKSGLSVGRAPLHLTVYGKRAHLQLKSDELYRRAMVDRRWGCDRPDKAARIEFQARRLWLQKHGVDSVEDLFRLSGSVIEKLSSQWFRLTAEPVDRKNNNQGRVGTLPEWLGIQAGFAQVFGKPAGPLEPIQRERIYPDRLIKQGRGCLINAMLQMGKKCQTFDDFMFVITELIHRTAPTPEDENKLIEEYRRRLTEFAA